MPSSERVYLKYRDQGMANISLYDCTKSDRNGPHHRIENHGLADIFVSRSKSLELSVDLQLNPLGSCLSGLLDVAVNRKRVSERAKAEVSGLVSTLLTLPSFRLHETSRMFVPFTMTLFPGEFYVVIL